MTQQVKKKRPGIRDPRRTRQPLKIDKLPAEVHAKILELRNKDGRTWEQIEEASHKFVDWPALDPEVADLFGPDFRLPASSLHRWYHLHLERVRDEVVEEGAAAESFIQKLAALGVNGMDDAVMSAMTREVFGLIKDAGTGNRLNLIDGLNSVSLVLARLKRTQIAEQKVKADIAKSEAERAKFAAEAGDPKEIYLKAARDILQKLRTRQPVREVIDPIREDLITEMAHAADTFAKQIEASNS